MGSLGIHSIFDKKNGSYTRRALFYQDILRYSSVIKETNKGSFKDRELTYWLLENNQELKNYYVDSDKHTPPSKRVENRLDRVKASVEDLVNMGLMLQIGTIPSEKGGTRPVQLYNYTSDGKLLACLVESLDPTKREKAYNNAYVDLQSILNREPRASYEIFHSALYEKYKDRGVFGEFIMDRLRESVESFSEIKTMDELHYMSLILFRTSDAEKGKLYLDLWNEVFNVMEPVVQELLLFNMKMEIEQRMVHKAMVPHKYERYRLKFIHVPAFLTMEGYCKKCNLGYPLVMNLMQYHERTNFLPNDPIMQECPNCKDKSLHIPTL